MAPEATNERSPGETDGPAPLRDVAHLYVIADDLTARCQTGAAESVLAEIAGPLAEAAEAGAAEVVNRLHYAVALGNLELGRLDDTVATCDRIINELGERGDAAWLACSHGVRGTARRLRGDHLAAVTDLVDAAVLLDDAHPTGQSFIFAVQQLAIGYKGLRLYELALEEYARAQALVARPAVNLSRVLHLLDRMLVEIYWGMELDRLGRAAEAREHYRAALGLSAGAAPLPRFNHGTWALRLRARVGLCRAMIGEADAAVADLEPTVATMTRHRVDDEALARIGLVRAYAEVGRTELAIAEGARAELAADVSQDPQLVLAVVWEQVRLGAGAAEPPDAVVIDYARQLERERWDERERFVRETRDRLESERARRTSRKMSAEYLTDGRTGLGNRRHLELRLREMVSRAQSLDEVLTLAFVDLDPATSTEAMAGVGRRLAERAAPHGFVARYGGTELVLLAPRLSGREAASMIRDGMHGSSEPPPAVGIASVQAPLSVAGFVATADEALHAARRSGGGVRLATA